MGRPFVLNVMNAVLEVGSGESRGWGRGPALLAAAWGGWECLEVAMYSPWVEESWRINGQNPGKWRREGMVVVQGLE